MTAAKSRAPKVLSREQIAAAILALPDPDDGETLVMSRATVARLCNLIGCPSLPSRRMFGVPIRYNDQLPTGTIETETP